MSFYRRNLPHWQPDGAEYFVTFRLAGSLPRAVVANLKHRREELLREAENDSCSTDSLSVRKRVHRHIFGRYDNLLDKGDSGPVWLENSEVAKIMKEALHYRDQKKYDLYAYCLMPNHVHLVFQLLNSNRKSTSKHRFSDYPVTDLMKNIKSYTAVRANQVLERSGTFWHRESYDRVIRDSDELKRTIAYILNNPVKAGLAKKWQDWPHSYCKPKFLPDFSTPAT